MDVLDLRTNMHMDRLPFLLTVLAFGAGATTVRGQSALNPFSAAGRAAVTTFVTDYQSIGINPANLGWKGRFEGKHVTFGLLEGAYTVHSDALKRADFRERVLNTDFRFTEREQEEAGRIFANAGAMANADLVSIGFSYANENLGGLAFHVRDRIEVSAKFGQRMAEILFRGYRADYFDLLVLATGDTVANYANMSPDSLAMVILGVATEPMLLGRVVKGTDIGMNWYREFNFSYGRHLIRTDNFELDLGFGLKYLLGIGIVDIRSQDNRLDGFSSLSDDFQIDYQNVEFMPGARLTGGMVAFPKAVGNGFGGDVGISMLFNKAWKVGLAVTDIGAIRWKGNVYKATEGSLVDLAIGGLENLDVISGLEDFVTNSGVLTWERAQARVLPLPTTARLGAGKLLGEWAEAGIDAVLPLNDATGSLRNPVFGAGADLLPTRWLRFSSGLVVGGGMPLKLPVGLAFIAGNGTWECGLASRDVITYFTQTNPTLSLGLGFLRFRF